MATSPDILCGICEAQHITKFADHWCPECDEGLCSACETHFHKISKGTRNHGIIAIEIIKNCHHVFQKSVITAKIMT